MYVTIMKRPYYLLVKGIWGLGFRDLYSVTIIKKPYYLLSIYLSIYLSI